MPEGRRRLQRLAMRLLSVMGFLAEIVGNVVDLSLLILEELGLLLPLTPSSRHDLSLQ